MNGHPGATGTTGVLVTSALLVGGTEEPRVYVRVRRY